MNKFQKPAEGLPVRFVGQDHDKQPITDEVTGDMDKAPLVKATPNK